MNDEYLWNKKGDDADIARLEDVLSKFKYVPTPAPVVNTKRPYAWLRSAIPIASAAALAMALILWSIGTRRPQVAAGNDAPQIVTFVEQMPVVTKGEVATTIPPTAEKPLVLRAVYKPRRAIAATRKTSSQSTPVRFTAEEKHAYQQVLLALYIAGSQLKSVNDTIAGIETKRSEDR